MFKFGPLLADAYVMMLVGKVMHGHRN
jgi:acyl-CoA oxidase